MLIHLGCKAALSGPALRAKTGNGRLSKMGGELDDPGQGLTKLEKAGKGCPSGPMAEWLRRGLQILARRFDSGSGLHFPMNIEPTLAFLGDEGPGEQA